jgi:hypothetical protein
MHICSNAAKNCILNMDVMQEKLMKSNSKQGIRVEFITPVFVLHRFVLLQIHFYFILFYF